MDGKKKEEAGVVTFNPAATGKLIGAGNLMSSIPISRCIKRNRFSYYGVVGAGIEYE